MEKGLLEKVLQTSLSRGGSLAEIFYEDTITQTLSAEDGELEEVRTGIDEGIGIRLQRGKSISYAFTDDLRKGSLLEIADLVSRSALEEKGNTVLDLTRKKRSSPHQFQVFPHKVSLEEKASLVLKADQGAREKGEAIKQVMISYLDKHQKILIARSDGLLVEDERVYTRLGIHVVAHERGIIQTGSEVAGGFQGFELFQKEDPFQLGGVAGEMALTMLRAREAPTGSMPVVINNGFGGVLFHEACGHGLEIDAVQKEASVYSGRKGEKVATDIVTAIDDATLINEWGSYGVDDEGEEPQRTVLIENGILLDYMYDLQGSRKEGRSSTGNGRRQSYKKRPLPRMSNTFIAPGKWKREEIFAAIDHGFYAHNLGGGQVDPATGDFTFSVREGYLIEKGKIGEPVRGATLIGNGPKVLLKIGMIADDLVISSGICGKDGQSVPASVGQPTLLIEDLTIGGTQDKGGN